MPEVWQLNDGAGVTVAVIDSGVDASVSELSDAVVPGTDLVEGGDGTVDNSDAGHGTAMASLVAGRGGSGVAPAATVLPIGVERALYSDDVMATAIRYAVDNGAQVINVSWGGPAADGCTEIEAAAIRYALNKDVVVVAASGNDPGGQSDAPGACPGVLTVAAVDQGLEVADYSHRSEHVEVAAPGTTIRTARPGGAESVGDGTSNSTALVSGVVALVRAEYPDASAYQVVARVLATVEDLGEPGRDDATGYGMVRPYEALTADVPPDAPNPVFDNAGDLTDVAPPSEDFVAPDAPDFGAPPGAGDGGGPAIAPIIAIAAVGGLLLIAAVAVIAIVVARSRRRQPHPYPPGPPLPPYRPGPPGPQ